MSVDTGKQVALSSGQDFLVLVLGRESRFPDFSALDGDIKTLNRQDFATIGFATYLSMTTVLWGVVAYVASTMGEMETVCLAVFIGFGGLAVTIYREKEK